MSGQSRGYDAFFSYSHHLDAGLTARLQTAVQQFAKPWYRLRALRAFRDETSLAASPHLWATIEEALAVSRWMVLMASPDSAQSDWVEKEIWWWRDHRSTDRMLIALTAGDIVWDPVKIDMDWDSTTALSQDALAKAFRQEPRWVDLRWVRDRGGGVRAADPRLQGAVADLAAAIRQVPKDSLIGEHLRQQRKTRRIAISAVAALVIFLGAAVTAAFVAKNQSDRATQQATVAEAGLLAATAKSLTGSRLDLAQLFAAEGYRLHPDAQTRSALYDTVQADPHLVRFLKADGTVSALDASADGGTFAVGTTNGLVQRWNLRDFKRDTIARLNGNVAGVSVSENGSTIGAIGKSEALVWQAGAGVKSLSAPRISHFTAIGVSASGESVVLAAGSRVYCIDIDSARITAERNTRTPVSRIVLSATQAVTFDSDSGQWYRFTIPNLTEIAQENSEYFGVQKYATAISPTGRYIAYDNGGALVQAWSTYHAPAQTSAPEFAARTGALFPTALAISRDGRWIAAADTSALHVASIVESGQKVTAPTVLRGGGSFGRKPLAFNAVTFVGPYGNRLISAAGDLLALWDLDQYSRIGTQVTMKLPTSCEHCGPPYLSVLPDGRTALVLVQDSSSTYFTPVRLQSPPRVEAQRIPIQGLPIVWGRNGNKSYYLANTIAASLSEDGKRIIAIGNDGTISVRNPATNRIDDTIKSPVKFNIGEAAIDAQGKYVALVDFSYGRVDVVNISTRQVQDIKAAVSGVDYAGEALLIQHKTGVLEIRNAAGSPASRQEIEVGPTPLGDPVGSRSGLAVIPKQDGTATIADLDTASSLGTLVLPAGPRGPESTGITFTPDGSWLVMATEGFYPEDIGKLTRVNMSYRSWAGVACSTSGHGLTRGEWQAYVSVPPPANLACGSG